MCLIVDRPPGAIIPDDHLRNGIDSNPDGWGIMYPGDDPGSEVPGLVIRRGMTKSGFWGAYRAVPTGVRLGIHFRWATHGARSVENAHPLVHRGAAVAVMHNGVIDIPCRDPARSDTYHYVSGVLGPWLLEYPDGLNWADECVGPHVSGSRLLVFRADGAAVRVNGESGTVIDGIWYSNTSSIRPVGYGSGRYSTGGLTPIRGYCSDGWGDDSGDDEWVRDAWRDAFPIRPKPRPAPISAESMRAKVRQVRTMLYNIERNQGSKKAEELAWQMTASRKPHVVRAAWQYLGFPEGDPTLG